MKDFELTSYQKKTLPYSSVTVRVDAKATNASASVLTNSVARVVPVSSAAMTTQGALPLSLNECAGDITAGCNSAASMQYKPQPSIKAVRIYTDGKALPTGVAYVPDWFYLPEGKVVECLSDLPIMSTIHLFRDFSLNKDPAKNVLQAKSVIMSFTGQQVKAPEDRPLNITSDMITLLSPKPDPVGYETLTLTSANDKVHPGVEAREYMADLLIEKYSVHTLGTTQDCQVKDHQVHTLGTTQDCLKVESSTFATDQAESGVITPKGLHGGFKRGELSMIGSMSAIHDVKAMSEHHVNGLISKKALLEAAGFSDVYIHSIAGDFIGKQYSLPNIEAAVTLEDADTLSVVGKNSFYGFWMEKFRDQLTSLKPLKSRTGPILMYFDSYAGFTPEYDPNSEQLGLNTDEPKHLYARPEPSTWYPAAYEQGKSRSKREVKPITVVYETNYEHDHYKGETDQQGLDALEDLESTTVVFKRRSKWDGKQIIRHSVVSKPATPATPVKKAFPHMSGLGLDMDNPQHVYAKVPPSVMESL